MEKHTETTVELALDQIDVRALLAVEVLLVSGGEFQVGLY